MTSKKTRQTDHRDPRWIAFGRRLVTLRNKAGWRAMDVARLVEIDPATYSRLEHGERKTGPERGTVEKIADLYRMSVADLMGEPQKEAHVSPPAAADPGARIFRRAEPDQAAIAYPDIRQAVSDAIYAIVHDILTTLGEARRDRAPADLPGEASRSGTDPSGRNARR